MYRYRKAVVVSGPKYVHALEPRHLKFLVGDKDPDADSVDVHTYASLNFKRHSYSDSRLELQLVVTNVLCS